MKKILIFSLAMLLGASLFGQVKGGNPNRPLYLHTVTIGYEQYGQMWNPANTYYNTPTSSNLGIQKDTVVASATTNIGICGFYTGYVNTDTFDYVGLNGSGTLDFYSSTLRAGVLTPTVTATLQSSLDGVKWASVPAATVFTLSPTSLTVPVTCQWHLANKLGLMFRTQFVNGVDTVMCQSWWYYNKNVQYWFGAK